MSLYISNRQILKMNSFAQKQAFLLLEAPGLHMQHRAFPEDYEFSQLLMDSFELTNSEMVEAPYPLLPYVGLWVIFLFNGNRIRASLCGATTTLKKLVLSAGDTAFCIRLRPGTFSWFRMDLPASGMANCSEELTAYMSIPLSFLPSIRRGESFHERNVLFRRQLHVLKASEYTMAPVIVQSLQLIQEVNGEIKISTVAEKVGCSTRYLNQIFQERVGVSAKLFCEMIQLDASLSDVLITRPHSLQETALAYGYFDQTHMNRSYRRFLGCTAGEMRNADYKTLNLDKVPSILQ